jgi:hypothetical protein
MAGAWKKLIFISLSYTGYCFLGYGLTRDQFPLLLGTFILLFALLTTAKSFANGLKIKQIITIGVLFRLSLLISSPELSDDFFRFVWDGRILLAGENPYLHLPAVLISAPEISDLGLTQELYNGLNSKNYFTVYPPVGYLCHWSFSWRRFNCGFDFLDARYSIVGRDRCDGFYGQNSGASQPVGALGPMVRMESLGYRGNRGQSAL